MSHIRNLAQDGRKNPVLGKRPRVSPANNLKHKACLAARYSVSMQEPFYMETSTDKMIHQLNTCISDRQQAANELQNEVNQVLAAALLWIRFAKTENKLDEDPSVYNAERSLQEAIQRVRALHYTLAQDV